MASDSVYTSLLRWAAPSSAKILHQHEIAAALIHLRKEDRSSVWRDGQARLRWREGLVQRGDHRHFAGREVEEFDDRANGLIRRGKVDPFLGHSPKATIASFVVIHHRRLGASRHRRLPDAGNRTAFRIIKQLAVY